MTVEVDPLGSTTSPAGFSADGIFCGVKEPGDGKLDLGVLVSGVRSTAAAVFTKNRLNSAHVDLDRAKLADGHAQAIVLTSGIANSSTGPRGVEDAERMAVWAGARTGLDATDVLVSSTGVIGEYLPMDKLEEGIASLNPRSDGGVSFARSMIANGSSASRPVFTHQCVNAQTLEKCEFRVRNPHPRSIKSVRYRSTGVGTMSERNEKLHAVRHCPNLRSVCCR